MSLRIRTVFSARQDPSEQSGIVLLDQVEECHKKLSRKPSRAWAQRCAWALLLALVATIAAVRSRQRAAQNQLQKLPIYTFPETDKRNAGQRPHFIFHIGPPKTGTTTLQYALSDYLPTLKKDNYQYLGQVMLNPSNMWNHTHGGVLNILKDRQCMQEVNHARVYDEEYPDCWMRLRTLLREYRRGGQSLILSEENFSIKYVDLEGGLERAPIDWQALADVLEDQGWHPVVVIGYRRLFEIMPSAKQQWDRWQKRNPTLNAWPPEGRALQPLFPEVLNDPRLYDGYTSNWRRPEDIIQWSYTDHLLRQISPFLEVRMMNIHQDVSLRTNFLCHVIPGAPKSCEQSLLDDATQGESVHNTEESLFFDALGCAAAERELFDTDEYERRQVAVAIRDQNEEFPLVCPPQEHTQLLLERSLVKEQQLWPADWVAMWRGDHIRKFEKSLKKFCWIDIEATLRDEKWQSFFENIGDYID